MKAFFENKIRNIIGIGIIFFFVFIFPNISLATNSCLDNITSFLSLKVIDSAKNPTVFYLQNCSVWKKEGSGTPRRLTNPNIKVHALTFTDLTGPNSTGVVRISITMSNVDAGVEPSFINVVRTYTTTASVKAWSGE